MIASTLVEARRLNPQRELALRWEDGHQATIPWRVLRGFCPCAGCQGHHAAAITFRPAGDPDLESVAAVGAYALSLGFADGHGTGIYSFDLLRRMCPCESCTTSAGPVEHRSL